MAIADYYAATIAFSAPPCHMARLLSAMFDYHVHFDSLLRYRLRSPPARLPLCAADFSAPRQMLPFFIIFAPLYCCCAAIISLPLMMLR